MTAPWLLLDRSNSNGQKPALIIINAFLKLILMKIGEFLADLGPISWFYISRRFLAIWICLAAIKVLSSRSRSSYPGFFQIAMKLWSYEAMTNNSAIQISLPLPANMLVDKMTYPHRRSLSCGLLNPSILPVERIQKVGAVEISLLLASCWEDYWRLQGHVGRV